jgi:thiosulfate reductase cytochrome b subunit
MKQQELHPLPLRIWHWTNTVLVLLLIITGVRLMIPDLHLMPDYRSAVILHRRVGYAMAASFMFWLLYGIASGSLSKYYPIRSRDLKGLCLQARYHAFGVFTGATNPFPATAKEKFNPLQKIAYVSTMLVFTPVIVISGIFYSNIILFRDTILLLGGIRVLDAVHLATAYIFANYFIVHVYMSTMGRTPFSHTKEMITGRAEHPES